MRPSATILSRSVATTVVGATVCAWMVTRDQPWDFQFLRRSESGSVALLPDRCITVELMRGNVVIAYHDFSTVERVRQQLVVSDRAPAWHATWGIAPSGTTISSYVQPDFLSRFGFGITTGALTVGYQWMAAGFPLWVILVPAIAICALQCIGYRRRVNSRRGNRCAECGYDLRGGGRRCPECGTHAATPSCDPPGSFRFGRAAVMHPFVVGTAIGVISSIVLARGRAGATEPGAWCRSGDIRNNVGDYRGALNDFSSALAIDPWDRDALIRRADVERDIGMYDAALADYSHLLEGHPGDDIAHNNRGLLLYELGRDADAIGEYSSAIRLHPTAVYFDNCGIARQRSGDVAGAILDFSEAIHIVPTYEQAVFNLAYARECNLDYRSAAEDYTRALQISPHDHDALAWRGRCYLQLGSPDKAIEDETAVIRRRPTETEFLIRAEAELVKHAVRLSVRDYTLALTMPPDDVPRSEVHRRRAEAYRMLGEGDRQATDLNEAARLEKIGK